MQLKREKEKAKGRIRNAKSVIDTTKGNARKSRTTDAHTALKEEHMKTRLHPTPTQSAGQFTQTIVVNKGPF